MDAQTIRQAFLDFFAARGHSVIERSSLVPKDDPTTLFTGSGMQPLLPYLLGAEHPQGKRLADSQTCLRAEDINEVGDNRHTTFFEMLGNWSLGDYFKKEQLSWYFEFLTEVVGLDPNKLYVTAFAGDEEVGVSRDTESAAIWKELFAKKGIVAEEAVIGSEEAGRRRGMKPGERIFFYDAKKNWWSRSGAPGDMPAGEPGGPDSEVFFEFSHIRHDPAFGEHCHPNCECGRYMEIGNSVFMTYLKTDSGFSMLPRPNVDFGGGLERLAAAAEGSGDVFKISLLWPLIERLEKLSSRSYQGNQAAMRVIADHLRGALFLSLDGVTPSNKEQGYVLRRLIRRAVRFGLELGIERDLLTALLPSAVAVYQAAYPELRGRQDELAAALSKEEKLFRQTLSAGIRHFDKEIRGPVGGEALFKLHDTYGFPLELSLEEVKKRQLPLADGWRQAFDEAMRQQRERSRTATRGQFKGGLEGHSDTHKKYHTATHLMYKALRLVLGDHVVQRGSNITEQRLRFDFSHPEKVTAEQLQRVEDMVNEQIAKDLPMTWREYPTDEALRLGALGAFGDKYGDTVKVYQAGEGKQMFSLEICGGPHVERTSQLAEGGKRFKILKEESSSSGVRRIKAALV